MNPIDLLREDQEEMPGWLREHRGHEPFNHEEFFGSRTVYCPGSSDYSAPLRFFGRAYSAHAFVFVDFGVAERHFMKLYSDAWRQGHPRGYKPVFVQRIDIDELGAWGSRPTSLPAAAMKGTCRYGVFSVHERFSGYGAAHGPERIALLTLGVDGVFGYDGLYGQRGMTPYAVVLPDHDLSADSDRLGGPSSPLYRLAAEFTLPTWLLVTDHTDPWPGYTSTYGNHDWRMWKRVSPRAALKESRHF